VSSNLTPTAKTTTAFWRLLFFWGSEQTALLALGFEGRSDVERAGGERNREARPGAEEAEADESGGESHPHRLKI